MHPIQMVDLKRQYHKIKNEIDEAVLNVIESTAFIGGKPIQEFANNLSTYLGIKHVIPCANGTDALQIAMMALDLKPGDEVITPSFTFIATTEVIALLRLTPVFVEVDPKTFCMDPIALEKAITPKTKAIVVVHYAGVACNMEKIMSLAKAYHLFVIEDAAQSIDSFYEFEDGTKKPLGSIGHLAAFSFHETKNIISGEGGMLVVNDDRFAERAEIIWEKGTNRSAFFRGEIDKYNWVDIGSSFLPSEVVAAFLYAQLEHLDEIQVGRKKIWSTYCVSLTPLECYGVFKVPHIPGYATNNGHMFYLVFNNSDERARMIEFLKEQNINAVFHYLSLHKSPFYAEKHDGRALNNCDFFSEGLLRLPMYYELQDEEVKRIVDCINNCLSK